MGCRPHLRSGPTRRNLGVRGCPAPLHLPPHEAPHPRPPLRRRRCHRGAVAHRHRCHGARRGRSSTSITGRSWPATRRATCSCRRRRSRSPTPATPQSTRDALLAGATRAGGTAALLPGLGGPSGISAIGTTIPASDQTLAAHGGRRPRLVGLRHGRLGQRLDHRRDARRRAGRLRLRRRPAPSSSVDGTRDPASSTGSAPRPARRASPPGDDTDGDGIPDTWEKDHGAPSRPTTPADRQRRARATAATRPPPPPSPPDPGRRPRRPGIDGDRRRRRRRRRHDTTPAPTRRRADGRRRRRRRGRRRRSTTTPADPAPTPDAAGRRPGSGRPGPAGRPRAARRPGAAADPAPPADPAGRRPPAARRRRPTRRPPADSTPAPADRRRRPRPTRRVLERGVGQRGDPRPASSSPAASLGSRSDADRDHHGLGHVRAAGLRGRGGGRGRDRVRRRDRHRGAVRAASTCCTSRGTCPAIRGCRTRSRTRRTSRALRDRGADAIVAVTVCGAVDRERRAGVA